jgi:hypothetical protein
VKKILPLVLGILACLVAYTLFGSVSLIAVALLYALTLWILFFSNKTVGLFFLIGLTVGQELFAQGRFGFAAVLALLIFMLHHFFGERLRFTSAHARYIAALAATFILYSVDFYPLGHLVSILETLAFLLPICLGLSYIGTSFNRSSTYELL